MLQIDCYRFYLWPIATIKGGTQGGVYLSSSPKIFPQIKKFIPKPLFFWKFIPIPYACQK